eukprot:1822214-Pleurochrysis_carterae.AAC.2
MVVVVMMMMAALPMAAWTTAAPAQLAFYRLEQFFWLVVSVQFGAPLTCGLLRSLGYVPEHARRAHCLDAGGCMYGHNARRPCGHVGWCMRGAGRVTREAPQGSRSVTQVRHRLFLSVDER